MKIYQYELNSLASKPLILVIVTLSIAILSSCGVYFNSKEDNINDEQKTIELNER